MNGIWERMRVAYRGMGLTEEEICDRIICKTTKVIGNLDECDEKRKKTGQ